MLETVKNREKQVETVQNREKQVKNGVAEDKVKLYKVKEVCELLGMKDMFVRQLIWSGRLRSVRLGRAVRVRHADLEAFLDAAQHIPPAQRMTAA